VRRAEEQEPSSFAQGYGGQEGEGGKGKWKAESGKWEDMVPIKAILFTTELTEVTLRQAQGRLRKP